MRDMSGEILSRLYHSEIHLTIQWCWDGGVQVWFQPLLTWGTEDEPPDMEFCDADDMMVKIADAVSLDFPDSEFAKWWLGVGNGAASRPKFRPDR